MGSWGDSQDPDYDFLSKHLGGGAKERGATSSLNGLNPDFARRLAAFIRASPHGMNIFSGYRSPDLQRQLFNASDRSGHMVAPPGRSMHGKGFAADISGDSAWAHQHAAEYGLNFPMSYEPWHVQPSSNFTGNIPTQNQASPSMAGYVPNSTPPSDTPPGMGTSSQTTTQGDTIFSGSPSLWNAPTEPTMSLGDSPYPYASQEVPGSPLPTEPIDYSGNQYLDQPSANASPALQPSLSLSPLVNPEGNYQMPESAATPTATPYSQAPVDNSTSSGNPSQMGSYDPNFNYGQVPLDSFTQAAFSPSNVSGSGGPTQRGVGMVVGTASNFLIPGLGFLTGPLARLITRGIQGAGQNNSTPNSEPPADNPDKVGGGMGSHTTIPNSYSPFGGLPPGYTQGNRMYAPGPDQFSPGGNLSIGQEGAPSDIFTGSQGPQFNQGSIFTSPTNLAMALPGSFAGLGEGSLGDMPFFSRLANQAYMRGDPGMGLDNPGNAIMQDAAWRSQNTPHPVSFASIAQYLPGGMAAMGGPMAATGDTGSTPYGGGFPFAALQGGGGFSAFGGGSKFGSNGRQLNAV